MKRTPPLAIIAAIACIGWAPTDAAAQVNQTAAAARADHHPSFADELASAEAAGIPTKLSQIFAAPPPASQNAALIYQRMSDDLKRRPVSEADMKLLSSLGTPGATKAVASRAGKLLREHAQLLALAELAATRPADVDPHQVVAADPSTIPFPLLFPMSVAGRFVMAHSVLLARQRHTQEALHSQEAGFQLADHAASQPLLIPYLEALSINRTTLQGLQRILALSHGSPQVASAVRLSVHGHFRTRSLSKALASEMAMTVAEANYIRTSEGPSATGQATGDNSSRPASPQSTPDSNAFADASAAMAVRLLREEIACADLPYPQAKTQEDAVMSEISPDSGPVALLAAITLPPASQAEVKKAATTATAEITVAAADVFLWKAKHGVFPGALSEAEDPAPIDPFDLKALRYRKERNGFVIYSVGESLAYDGDASNPNPNFGEVVFRYPDSPR